MKIAPVVAGLALTLFGVAAPGALSSAAAMPPTKETVPVATDSTITLGAPPLAAVAVGRSVTVRGTVTGGTEVARTVRLELDTVRGWMPLTSVQTDADGTYAATVPTDWLYTGRIRASVTATETHTSASSPTFAMTVKPAYVPRGSTRDHVLTNPDVRWNPCEVIGYRVNTTGAPERALRLVKRAVALTARATGFTFRYAGSTDAIAWRDDRKGTTWSNAELTISWGTDRQVGYLRGSVVGLGGWVWARNGEILSGGVVLDRSATLRPGFKAGATWGTLLLHEIGHAMNLDHAKGVEQVMHSGINDRSPGDFQAGDLTGLAKTGAMGGCVDGDGSAGTARAVRVQGHPIR